MPDFTSNTYQMKQKILTFTNKISRRLSKPEKKFAADITYGILASGSCLLTDVADQLHEPSKKINTVDRLSRHLENGTPASAAASYLRQVKKMLPDEPVVHIVDSDVVKPDGSKFESLGIVRDGSESTSVKSVYKKGYHVTEACVLTRNAHPVSIFSRIHSSSEKDYKSVNTVTFQAMQQGAALFGKAAFCMDRGYDDNKMFLKLDGLKQDYVIRLKSNRKLLYHNRWTMASQLRDRRKGKIKTNIFYKGKDHEAYLCMAFLGLVSMESETNALKVSIIKTAAPVKQKVFFCYYRLAKGISGILSYAKEGVRLWFRTKRPKYRQLCLKLAV